MAAAVGPSGWPDEPPGAASGQSTPPTLTSCLCVCVIVDTSTERSVATTLEHSLLRAVSASLRLLSGCCPIWPVPLRLKSMVAATSRRPRRRGLSRVRSARRGGVAVAGCIDAQDQQRAMMSHATPAASGMMCTDEA
eukprot:6179601-Pleurochrysis_carterae.AAC.5